VVDGKIYVIGGITGNLGPWVSTVEAYDPLTDSWTKKADELVAYWKLDETEGDIAYNNVSENHGILRRSRRISMSAIL
jgi:hypothetical protein